MFYSFMRMFLRCFFKLFFKVQVVGLENIPKEGALILAANHISNWDPPFLATFLEREVHYMAKEELFVNPVFAAAIRKLHAFPVKRGAADKNAIKHAVTVLKNNECLGLFPEGTRSKTGEIGKAEAGVGLITAMTKSAVLPAAIIGTNEIFSKSKFFPKLTVVYGEPMQFEGNVKDKKALAEFSQSIMNEIANLRKNFL